MKRRTKGLLLVGTLAAGTVVALGVTLAPTVARTVDNLNVCKNGFSSFVSCSVRWSTTSVGQGTPIPGFTVSEAEAKAKERAAHPGFQPGSVDKTSWSVAHCPENRVARQLLCATPNTASVESAGDDGVTGLPLPMPWFVRTSKNSPLIRSMHVETPIDLSVALGFFRAEFTKRGWIENGGATVAADRARITYMTIDGPAVLRLNRSGDTTIADVSLLKNAGVFYGFKSKPGQAAIMLGNALEDEAVVTINERTVTLPKLAGDKLAFYAADNHKLPEDQKLDLAPGKYKVTTNVDGDTQSREFEVAAGETWSLMVGPDGVPLPLHIY